MTQVAGKAAFITGGGSGVGFGQAKVFADAGCKIAIADVRRIGRIKHISGEFGKYA